MPSEAVRTKQADRKYDRARQGGDGTTSPKISVFRDTHISHPEKGAV
ncbi:hypothetical protein L2W58_07165 [Dethiosulfovibrio sp. F2B]|nr:hypothetical protein [Dethiosulfovibrio faecalis]MCF4151579.1 hypothetical protein [Dethiosulfovibrio faecalis]